MSVPSSRLDAVSRDLMLRNALSMLERSRRIQGLPRWSVIADLCGVGSTSANQICEELGWPAHERADKALPRY